MSERIELRELRAAIEKHNDVYIVGVGEADTIVLALLDAVEAARRVVDTTAMIYPAGGMDELEVMLDRLDFGGEA